MIMMSYLKKKKRIKRRDLSETIRNKILFGIKWSPPETQPFKIRLKWYFIRTKAEYKWSLPEWTRICIQWKVKEKESIFCLSDWKNFSTESYNFSTYTLTSITSGVLVNEENSRAPGPQNQNVFGGEGEILHFKQASTDGGNLWFKGSLGDPGGPRQN